MSLSTLIHGYAQYNAWANTKMVDWLIQQEEVTLQATVASSFTSLDYTIQHLWRTEKFWTLFINEQPYQDFDWQVLNQPPRQTLLSFKDHSQHMSTVMVGFTEADLNKPLCLEMPWAKTEQPRYSFIQHIINHSTFHRGQLVTMARGLGITEKIPATDFNFFNMGL